MTSAPARDDERILFLDFEASGLGPASFPIEVGWAWLHGESGAMLIRPAPDWDLDSWDELAGEVHGIPLDELQTDGLDAREVAEHVVALTQASDARVLVLTDAPEYDQAWLDLLLSESPTSSAIRLVDVLQASRDRFCAPLEIDDAHAPAVHRAEPDAVRLRQLWSQLSELRQRQLG